MTDLYIIAFATIGALVVGFGATFGLIFWAHRSSRAGLHSK